MIADVFRYKGFDVDYMKKCRKMSVREHLCVVLVILREMITIINYVDIMLNVSVEV